MVKTTLPGIADAAVVTRRPVVDGRQHELYLVEPSPVGFKPLASAVILEPGDNWAPLALVDGTLLVCGQKELTALQVGR